MVLFDSVVQVFTGSDPHPLRQLALLLQIGYRAVGSSVSIECDLGGNALALHRPTEKGFGGIHVPFSAQVEINGFHPLCLPGVGARAATHTAFRRDRPSHGRVDSAAIARSVSVGDRATLCSRTAYGAAARASDRTFDVF